MVRRQQSFLLQGVYVGVTKKMGRGVFTKNAIEAGTVIELAPVIVMDSDARKLLDQTLLHDYIFEWGDLKEECAMALGLIPVYNHSYAANCEYEMYFKKQVISVKAVRDIDPGDELFINYNGDWDNKSPVWFPTKK